MRPRQRVPALSSRPRGPSPTTAQTHDLLASGDLEVVGSIVGASNATFLAVVRHDGREQPAVYKPVRGEQPLWDVPDGTLAGREVASSLVSRAGGWGIVPPTVLRDGPYGPGSVQQWVGEVDADGSPMASEPGHGLVDVVAPMDVPAGWHVVVRGSGYGGDPVLVVHADDPGLRDMALLDAAINNADRKAGHVLRAGGSAGGLAGAVVGVDHGLALNTDPKLRTVLWGWAGERIDARGRAMLTATLDALTRSRRAGDGSGGPGLRDTLEPLITRDEVLALRRRCEALLERGRHPRTDPRGPSLPWPLF